MERETREAWAKINARKAAQAQQEPDARFLERLERDDTRKSGFKEWEDVRKIGACMVKGSHCMNIEKAVPGATSLEIRNAIDAFKAPVGRGGPMTVTPEMVQRIVIEKLSKRPEPRSEIVGKLAQIVADSGPDYPASLLASQAEKIGATELEFALAKEANPSPAKSNFSHSGHYIGRIMRPERMNHA